MGFLQADYVVIFSKRGNVSENPPVPSVFTGLVRVVGERVEIMKYSPRMRNGGVEGAGRTVDLLRIH